MCNFQMALLRGLYFLPFFLLANWNVSVMIGVQQPSWTTKWKEWATDTKEPVPALGSHL